MKSLLILGSTGSIGTQTLDVVRSAPSGTFAVAGLAAGSNWQALLEQIAAFSPRAVALADDAAADRLRAALAETSHEVAVRSGPDALEELCRELDYDVAVHGVVGAAGLSASVAVLERGRDLALANKESLVIAGEQLMELSRRGGGRILPVDSELCALEQCLRGEDLGRVRRVVVTASGGPFRDCPLEDIHRATPAQALKHPTWDMGRRITIGSATLMNKALEVIEVHHLLGLEPERIAVTIHHQSIVHSLVEFVDGSVISQMGPPDMRGPLHYCLHHPERAPASLKGFDTELFSHLTFQDPDPARFPALELGYRCVREGADAGAVLNAADEVAVEAFLNGQIGLTDIARINGAVLDRRPGLSGDLARLLRSDAAARELAADQIAALATA